MGLQIKLWLFLIKRARCDWQGSPHLKFCVSLCSSPSCLNAEVVFKAAAAVLFLWNKNTRGKDQDNQKAHWTAEPILAAAHPYTFYVRTKQINKSKTKPNNFFKSKHLKKVFLQNSLVVQWLVLHTSMAKGPGSTLGWGTKIPQAARCSHK